MPSPAVAPCTKGCESKCAEIAKVERLQVEAKLATEVYKPTGSRHVDGYTEVTDPDELAKLGLTPEDLTPPDSEFRAGVFRKNGTKDYAVTFKGTTSGRDWLANGAQGTIGYSDYYQRAKSIGRDSAAMIGGKDVNSVKFIGHSLGGGLASAAAHATGQPATTFNAAGLHVLNRSWFNPPPIDAVRVNGEILTTAQALLKDVPIIAPEGAGTPYNIPAPSNVASTASRVKLDLWDVALPVRVPYKYAKAAVLRAVDLHLMTSVNPALEEQHERLKDAALEAGCRC